MTWNLYNKEGKFLEPLKFSNGKTQEDVVKEVLNEISKGKKVIFIHGVCGTGKSAVALNLAKELGKSSIIVPGKALQNQYKADYESNKYLLKDNGEKLKIAIITGRNNHRCKFLEDNHLIIPTIKKEVNANLNNIFEFSKEELEKKKQMDFSADKYDLPCKIELKEKYFYKIKEYIRKNKGVNPNNFHTAKDATRPSVAGVCPYWSPVFAQVYEMGGKIFQGAKKRIYEGLDGMKFVFYERTPGCGFYEQFHSYIDADIIVFNSLKYKYETALGRKPLTEAEIIDECDEFLDSFSNQRTINIDRLQNSLNQVFSTKEEVENIIDEIHIICNEIKKDRTIESAIYSNAIIPLKNTPVLKLLKTFISNPEFLAEVDEESYLFELEETAKMFEDFFNESYLSFSKKDNNLIVSIVTTNLAKKFRELIDKNKIIVLMSGTLHSESVLKNIFGLDDFVVLNAEVEQQGKIETLRTGLEMDCKYEKFSNKKNSREDYLKALSKCVSIAKKPVLIHINSFHDLPTENEIKELNIDNLISREKLKEIQKEDKTGKLIEEFKKGKSDILFSTKCTRGMDFPGEQCNSIIFTKYPNPDVKDAFWKILKQTNPNYYWDFYKDKARREIWQKVYRGLRFKEDHVYVLSPDDRVLKVFEKKV